MGTGKFTGAEMCAERVLVCYAEKVDPLGVAASSESSGKEDPQMPLLKELTRLRQRGYSVSTNKP